MAVITLFMENLLTSAPQLTNIIGKLIYAIYGWVGNFGWTVVVFTVLLKIAMLPLDLWQKNLMRKNNNAMKRIKPQLEKLQKQCGSDKAMYSTKQMELYKKEGYSMLGSCLPMIVTMVIFFIVFSGFRSVVKFQNEDTIFQIAEAHREMINDEYTEEQINTEILAIYTEKMDSWLWIKNVFMPDSYADVVPDYTVYSGTKLGHLNADIPDNLNIAGGYDALISPASEALNKKNFWDFANWNGYLILPILSLVLNIITQKTMKMTTPEMPMSTSGDNQQKSQASTMKMMQYMMPLMIAVFSVLYSSAFTIYLFFSAFLGIVFQVIFNCITKRIDSKKEEELLIKTFRK